MDRIGFAFIFLILGSGCVGELMRPVATARNVGSEVLSCEDVEVREADDDVWNAVPTEQRAFLVSGCGRQAWVVCNHAFEVQGSCEQRRHGPYASPQETEPHAFLLTTAAVPPGRNYFVDESISIGEDGWIQRRAGESPVIPIRPGRQLMTYDAALTRSRRWRQLNYTESNGSRYLNSVEVKTRVSVEAVCETRFSLTPQEGALYTMWVEFAGNSACSLHCQQYVHIDGQLVESSCPGFYADVDLIEAHSY